MALPAHRCPTSATISRSARGSRSTTCDPRIMAAVRPLASPPYLTVYIVLASSPDLVEAGPVAGRLTAVDYNASTIAASIAGPPVLVEPFPYRTFTPGEWPGVFR